jgi:hypothetical protein
MDDKGFWIGALLSVPLGVFSGVCSIFAYNWLMRQLEQRKLTKANETRQQAIRTYKLITAFRRGTKDKYTYYLLCVGWATALRRLTGCQLTYESRFRPRVWLRLRAAAGGNWTPEGNLQLEGEANFSLSWGT